MAPLPNGVKYSVMTVTLDGDGGKLTGRPVDSRGRCSEIETEG